MVDWMPINEHCPLEVKIDEHTTVIVRAKLGEVVPIVAKVEIRRQMDDET